MQQHALTKRQDTLRAICLLRTAPEFKLFLDALRSRREDIRDAIEDLDDHAGQDKLRGRSAEISEIFAVIEGSHDLLAKRMAAGK